MTRKIRVNMYGECGKGRFSSHRREEAVDPEGGRDGIKNGTVEGEVRTGGKTTTSEENRRVVSVIYGNRVSYISGFAKFGDEHFRAFLLDLCLPILSPSIYDAIDVKPEQGEMAERVLKAIHGDDVHVSYMGMKFTSTTVVQFSPWVRSEK
jgi:hypothetical protein